MFRESDAKGSGQAVQRECPIAAQSLEALQAHHQGRRTASALSKDDLCTVEGRPLRLTDYRGVIRLKLLPDSVCSGTAYSDIPLAELLEFLAISDKDVVN
jgi:hypothetical protein